MFDEIANLYSYLVMQVTFLVLDQPKKFWEWKMSWTMAFLGRCPAIVVEEVQCYQIDKMKFHVTLQCEWVKTIFINHINHISYLCLINHISDFCLQWIHLFWSAPWLLCRHILLLHLLPVVHGLRQVQGDEVLLPTGHQVPAEDPGVWPWTLCELSRQQQIFQK